jgi:tetratricopeptide (TPR) repeat protein
VLDKARLADGYTMSNRASRALSSTERAIELTPVSGDAWYFKGAALMRLKRYLEAIDALKKSIDYKPLKPDYSWELLGIIYNQMKLYPEAIAAYRKALELDPSNTLYKNNLGMALKDGLHLEEALILFEELKNNNPNDPFPWRQIGYVYGYQNKPVEAIPAMEKSVSLDPRQPPVWLNLARVYQAANRKDDCQRAYQQLQALDPKLAEQAYHNYILPFEGTP